MSGRVTGGPQGGGGGALGWCRCLGLMQAVLPVQVLQCRAAESSAAAADPTAGQISKELIERMEGSLRAELEADQVAVTDVYGDGRHVSIDIVSQQFEGQPSVKRQRMVYKVPPSPPCVVKCCNALPMNATF